MGNHRGQENHRRIYRKRARLTRANPFHALIILGVLVPTFLIAKFSSSNISPTGFWQYLFAIGCWLILPSIVLFIGSSVILPIKKARDKERAERLRERKKAERQHRSSRE